MSLFHELLDLLYQKIFFFCDVLSLLYFTVELPIVSLRIERGEFLREIFNLVGKESELGLLGLLS